MECFKCCVASHNLSMMSARTHHKSISTLLANDITPGYIAMLQFQITPNEDTRLECRNVES